MSITGIYHPHMSECPTTNVIRYIILQLRFNVSETTKIHIIEEHILEGTWLSRSMTNSLTQLVPPTISI